MTKEKEKMLDDCLNVEEGLSAWELDFIENLDENFRERQGSKGHTSAGRG